MEPQKWPWKWSRLSPRCGETVDRAGLFREGKRSRTLLYMKRRETEVNNFHFAAVAQADIMLLMAGASPFENKCYTVVYTRRASCSRFCCILIRQHNCLLLFTSVDKNHAPRDCVGGNYWDERRTGIRPVSISFTHNIHVISAVYIRHCSRVHAETRHVEISRVATRLSYSTLPIDYEKKYHISSSTSGDFGFLSCVTFPLASSDRGLTFHASL